MTRVIERNTTIPARRSETFTTAEDNQSAVDIVVLQGERERAADNRVLGRFRLEGIRAGPAGYPQVEVTFEIDANGILHVSARDKDTGKEQSITITETGQSRPAPRSSAWLPMPSGTGPRTPPPSEDRCPKRAGLGRLPGGAPAGRAGRRRARAREGPGREVGGRRPRCTRRRRTARADPSADRRTPAGVPLASEAVRRILRRGRIRSRPRAELLTTMWSTPSSR